MAEDLKPVEQTPQPADYSKFTKEQWTDLAKNDPGTFAEQTQVRMDTIFRQSRETQEKLTRAEQEKQNLLAEVNKLKQPIVPVTPIEVNEPLVYGNGNYPQNEAEWNDLFLERPAFATDLRNEYYQKRNVAVNEFETSRKRSVETLVNEHPDMYHYEIDAETNKPRLDKSGKPVVKKDPVTGGFAFNQDSEKGKLWVEIYNEDPRGWESLKNAPSLMMSEMERRLRIKGANVLQNGQNNVSDIDQSGVAPEGVPPPRNVSVKFDSDDERAQAEASVRRGTFKSVEEWKTYQNKGYVEVNRQPDFTKR